MMTLLGLSDLTMIYQGKQPTASRQNIGGRRQCLPPALNPVDNMKRLEQIYSQVYAFA
jgi:hypothetical protein